ncbi:hypothetical protein Xaut_0538 [Xanthobacter versatilis]|uniref:Uncharacterized protein n=1 Tax=Xanthobacter autotrophicus (strain ATCC BAA-1158 / Py2) TaxID=78245 RepID=A7ICQ1_XANP2|nr:hypothetical protein Xaut_0538 [Xanthobacter autotrophicus Py2]
MRSILLAAMLMLGMASPARAQLVGTDTAPGSSCAGFPDGATRMTADADLDGKDVVLVCDGTTWNAVSGSSGGNTFSFRASGGSTTSNSLSLVTNLSQNYDPNSVWDESGAADRYQPTEAGDYFIYLTANGNGCANLQVDAEIRLNSTAVASTGVDGPDQPGVALSTVVNMNGTTDYIRFYATDNGECSTIENIQVGGFKISGGGSGGGGGGASVLNDLTDVDTAGLADGKVLMYSAGASGWVPGTVSGGGSTDVSFYAYQTSGQSIPGGAIQTAINFGAERFDTNNNFNLTTDRFTPTVAGKYILTAASDINGLTSGYAAEVSIYKNGSLYAWGSLADSTNGESMSVVSVVADANGSTDYFQVYIINIDSSSHSTGAGADTTYFTGALVGGGGGGAPTCTTRSFSGVGTTISVSCQASEILTGGGCKSASTPITDNNYPSAADTWTCSFDASSASNGVYAICCAF